MSAKNALNKGLALGISIKIESPITVLKVGFDQDREMKNSVQYLRLE